VKLNFAVTYTEMATHTLLSTDYPW
jgi:hypothetical protein